MKLEKVSQLDVLLSWWLLDAVPGFLNFPEKLNLQRLNILMTFHKVSDNKDNIFRFFRAKKPQIEIKNDLEYGQLRALVKTNLLDPQIDQ